MSTIDNPYWVLFVDGVVIRFETQQDAQWYAAMMALKNTRAIYRGHS